MCRGRTFSPFSSGVSFELAEVGRGRGQLANAEYIETAGQRYRDGAVEEEAAAVVSSEPNIARRLATRLEVVCEAGKRAARVQVLVWGEATPFWSAPRNKEELASLIAAPLPVVLWEGLTRRITCRPPTRTFS